MHVVQEDTLDNWEELLYQSGTSMEQEAKLYDLQLVFIIDISGSMTTEDTDPEQISTRGLLGSYWSRYDNVVKYLQCSIDELYKYDKDGEIPLYFFGKGVKKEIVDAPSKVIAKCRRNLPTTEGTNMYEALRIAFEDNISQNENILFICFTDGCPAEGQEPHIVNLIEKYLKGNDPTGDRLNLLFVRIGDDSEAIKYLQYMDDCERIGDWVDTKSDNQAYWLGPKLLVLNGIYEHLESIPSFSEKLEELDPYSRTMSIQSCDNIDETVSMLDIKSKTVVSYNTSGETTELSGLYIEIDELEEQEVLGYGGSSEVVKGVYKDINVAIKKHRVLEQIYEQKLKLSEFEEHTKSFYREVMCLFNTSHPNILHCYGIVSSENYPRWIILEYAESSLHDLISDRGSLEGETVYKVSKEVLNGLTYLHKNGIIHRDIKPENIFLVDGVWKLGDMDMSKHLQLKGPLTYCGTEGYQAPEMLNGEDYDEKIDTWAFGVTIISMCIGRNDTEFKRTFIKNIKVYSKSVMTDRPLYKRIITKMCNRDPKKRWSSEKVLKEVKGMLK